jgi:hypothetical protein
MSIKLRKKSGEDDILERMKMLAKANKFLASKLWMELFQPDPEEVFGGLIVPVGIRGGGEDEAYWKRKSSMNLVNLNDNLAFPILCGYSMKTSAFKFFINELGKGQKNPLKEATLQATAKGFKTIKNRLSNAIEYLLECRKCTFNMIKEVQSCINKTKRVEITKFIIKDMSRFIANWSSFLMENEYWADGGRWNFYWYYPIITTAESESNIILPKQIKIKVSKLSRIIYIWKSFVNAITQSKGNRIQSQAIYIATKAFGFADKIDFPVLLEWLDAADKMGTPSIETATESDVAQVINKTFNDMTEAIKLGRKKLVVQDDTRSFRTAQIIVLEMIRQLILIVMNTAEWKKGLQEPGRQWNSELVVNTCRYDMEYDNDGLITWSKHVERISSQLGFPVKGTREWTAMVDLRGNADLSTIKFCKCRRNEIKDKWGAKGSRIDYSDIDTGDMDFWDEQKKAWYPMSGVEVDINGKLSFTGEWDTQSIVMVTKVMNFMKVYYRKAPFRRPELTISIMNFRRRWQRTLRSLAITDSTTYSGYTFLFSGRALDVDLSSASKYVLPVTYTRNFIKAIKKGLSVIGLSKLNDIADYAGGKVVEGQRQVKETIKEAGLKFDEMKQAFTRGGVNG